MNAVLRLLSTHSKLISIFLMDSWAITEINSVQEEAAEITRTKPITRKKKLGEKQKTSLARPPAKKQVIKKDTYLTPLKLKCSSLRGPCGFTLYSIVTDSYVCFIS